MIYIYIYISVTLIFKPAQCARGMGRRGERQIEPKYELVDLTLKLWNVTQGKIIQRRTHTHVTVKLSNGPSAP